MVGLEFQTAQSADATADPTPDQPTQSGSSVQTLDAFAGKYKMSGLPFDYIEVIPNEGHLFMKAGTNEGEFTPGSEAGDVKGGNNTVSTFGRDADEKVTSISLTVRGLSFKGTK